MFYHLGTSGLPPELIKSPSQTRLIEVDAFRRDLQAVDSMERETGFEPATSSLGSWHSTTELLPLACIFRYLTVPQGFSSFRGPSISSLKFIPTMGSDRKWKVNFYAKPRPKSTLARRCELFPWHFTTTSTYHNQALSSRRSSRRSTESSGARRLARLRTTKAL